MSKKIHAAIPKKAHSMLMCTLLDVSDLAEFFGVADQGDRKKAISQHIYDASKNGITTMYFPGYIQFVVLDDEGKEQTEMLGVPIKIRDLSNALLRLDGEKTDG